VINKSRTLLLNRSGSGFINRPGEEYISPEFSKIEKLPNYLSSIRTALYGASPDWLFENYKTKQYMSVLHGTDLRDFVTNLDSRITYDPFDTSMLRGTFGPYSSKPGLRFIGTPPGPDETGVSILRWRISSVDEGTTTVEQLTPRLPPRNAQCGIPDIVFDGLAIQFEPSPGTVWNVEYRRRPSRSIGETVYILENSTPQYWNDLFGTGTHRGSSEPWKTFRSLWLNHKQAPYRLGGMLLALIYGMEARRASGG
jgi:hypothetical protein